MRPSTFTLGKLAQIRYPEAGEFFGIIFSLFRSPVQIAGAVLCVDVRMRRPVHRPAVVSAALLTATSSTILNSSTACIQSLATQRRLESFRFLPMLRPLAEEHPWVHQKAFARTLAGGRRRCRSTKPR
jgi:hypothetical protein